MANANNKPSRLRLLLDSLLKLLRRKPMPPPVDPYAYVMAPVHRGPSGRSGAAVAEFEDDSDQHFSPGRY